MRYKMHHGEATPPTPPKPLKKHNFPPLKYYVYVLYYMYAYDMTPFALVFQP